VYADEETARSFDKRRFSGPIGELLAGEQARVLANFVGRIRDRSILDVGTGTGRAALLFARGGAVVTGIDASVEMLAVARQRMSKEGLAVTFREGDAHALDFGDRSFDVVVCLRVLMHAPQWRLCVSELCRVADRLVVLDYPSLHSFALLQSIVRHLLRLVGVRTEAYRVLSDGDVTRALMAAGFRVRSVHRQFVLPIALHKAIGSRKFTTRFERLLDRLGLLKPFGSPVTLVAERCELS
jgi:2-polyprenyl-3-methyl-5-hydroxy-6-metoxy-1,4-benzoquinol methylase